MPQLTRHTPRHRAGVPHVILPLWADLYNYAQTAEYLGIGIWPSQESALDWDAKALSRGFMDALKGERSESMKQKAKALAEVASSYGGRDAAAREIAILAAMGH